MKNRLFQYHGCGWNLILLLFAIGFILLDCNSIAWSQSNIGSNCSISGKITEVKRQIPLQGVFIIVKDSIKPSSDKSATSNSKGDYSIPGLKCWQGYTINIIVEPTATDNVVHVYKYAPSLPYKLEKLTGNQIVNISVGVQAGKLLRYGNWCGDGWSGGQSGKDDPIDEMDQACKNHDKDYEAAYSYRKAGDETKYNNKIRVADISLKATAERVKNFKKPIRGPIYAGGLIAWLNCRADLYSDKERAKCSSLDGIALNTPRNMSTITGSTTW